MAARSSTRLPGDRAADAGGDCQGSGSATFLHAGKFATITQFPQTD